MKGVSFSVLFIFLSFSAFSEEKENKYTIDSVYVSVNSEVVVNRVYNISFKDSVVIFETRHTKIVMVKNQRLRYMIDGTLIDPEHQIIKHRKENIYSEYQWPGKVIAKVKIIRTTSGFSFLKMEYIYIIATLLIAIIVYWRFKKEKISEAKALLEEPVRNDGNRIVERLKSLEYFKYVPTEGYMEELTEDLAIAINESNVLITVGIDDGYVPCDYKLYVCDGEELYEEGGLTENLEIVKAAFQVRALKLDWEDEKVDFKKNNFFHSIKLNGKEYIAYNDKYKDSSWGIAALNFMEMLNDQLELQNADERVYPINGGNDGQIIFLTKEQFEYISKLNLQEDFRPMEINKWKVGLA